MSIIPNARLVIFGGATLEGDRGPVAGRSAQRRRIALLSILAVCPRPVSRDKLVGYLWEESDTEKARRSLSESVYVIRKSLGEEALLSSGNELRLNPEVIWTDVGEFAELLKTGEDERAVALYQGPLLDGFFISDAPEFEQWVDRERQRLAREYAGALTRVARRAEKDGDYEAAAGWWQKLSEHDPYSAMPVLELMRSLDAANDRVAALNAARAHGDRLRDDLGGEPDPQVEAFAQELREAPPSPSPERIQPERAPVFEPLPRPTEMQAAPPPLVPWQRRRIRNALLALSIIGVGAVAAGVFLIGGLPPDPDRPGAAMLAIIPCSGSEAVADTRLRVAHELANNLDAAGELRTVDPYALVNQGSRRSSSSLTPSAGVAIAKQFDADMFVLCTVIEAGTEHTFTASLYSTAQPGTVLGKARAQGHANSFSVLVDSLSKQLLTKSGRPGETLRLTAANSTPSFGALKFFWTGDAHFLAGQYDSAVIAFQAAIREDSSFALAYYRLSAASEWNLDFQEAREAAYRAQDLSEGLPPQPKSLITPWVAFLEGRYDDAIGHYSNILSKFPHNVEAHAGLGEVLVHYNPLRGEPADSALPHFEKVLKHVPEYGEARFHVLELAAQALDTVRFDSVFNLLRKRNPQRIAFLAVQAAMRGAAEQRTVLAQLDTADEVAIGIAAGRVAAHTHNFPFARQIALKLAEPGRSTDWRAAAHLLLAQLALARNDWPTAQRQLVDSEPLDPDWTRQLSALDLLHPFVMAPRQQLIDERQRLLTLRPDSAAPNVNVLLGAHATVRRELRSYLLGLLSAASGEPDEAESYRTELLRVRREKEETAFAQALARSLSGHIARARKQPEEALRILKIVTMEARPEYLISPFYSRAHDRFTIGTLLQELGRPAEAIRWYESLLDGFDFPYAAPAHRALAVLYRTTDPVKAAAHDSAFARLTAR